MVFIIVPEFPQLPVTRKHPFIVFVLFIQLLENLRLLICKQKDLICKIDNADKNADCRKREKNIKWHLVIILHVMLDKVSKEKRKIKNKPDRQQPFRNCFINIFDKAEVRHLVSNQNCNCNC